jgi:hypothetical protein
MKYYIEIDDDEFFVHGVAVIYTIHKSGAKNLRVESLGEPAAWDRVGSLRAGAIDEESRLEEMFRQ